MTALTPFCLSFQQSHRLPVLLVYSLFEGCPSVSGGDRAAGIQRNHVGGTVDSSEHTSYFQRGFIVLAKSDVASPSAGPRHRGPDCSGSPCSCHEPVETRMRNPNFHQQVMILV